MPANTSSTTLYRIDECPEVMADACVGDDQGNLIFLSIWARDTAVQQFLARLTLGRDEQGLDQFHVITNQGGSVPGQNYHNRQYPATPVRDPFIKRVLHTDIYLFTCG